MKNQAGGEVETQNRSEALDFFDLLTFLGLVVAAFGAWLAYPPAGFMVGGGGAFFVGVRGPTITSRGD